MAKRPQSSVIGAAGEHLVLSHLLRLGFIAGKTPDFTKDYDLVALNEDRNIERILKEENRTIKYGDTQFRILSGAPISRPQISSGYSRATQKYAFGALRTPPISSFPGARMGPTSTRLLSHPPLDAAPFFLFPAQEFAQTIS